LLATSNPQLRYTSSVFGTSTNHARASKTREKLLRQRPIPVSIIFLPRRTPFYFRWSSNINAVASTVSWVDPSPLKDLELQDTKLFGDDSAGIWIVVIDHTRL
jgi:hypothetical protein